MQSIQSFAVNAGATARAKRSVESSVPVRYKVVTFALAASWLFNGILKWYPFDPSLLATPEAAAQQEFARYFNTLSQIPLALAAYFLLPTGKRTLPWPEFCYGVFIILMMFSRLDMKIEARSAIPFAFMVFVPFWLGSTLGSGKPHFSEYAMRRFGDVIEIVFVLGLLTWLIPGVADLRGLEGHGKRSTVYFTQFLGPVNTFVLVNRVACTSGWRRLLHVIFLLTGVFLSTIGWSRQEVFPTFVMLLALMALRPRWALPPLLGGALFILSNSELSETLRVGTEGAGDMTSGRANLHQYLWQIFLDNPLVGVGRGIAGYLAKRDIGDKNLGGWVEHGFVMHFAACGLFGILYAVVLFCRTYAAGFRVEFLKGFSNLPRQQRVLLSSCALACVGIPPQGFVGAFGSGTAFTDFCLLLLLGFATSIIHQQTSSSSKALL